MSPRRSARFAKAVPRNVKRRSGRAPASATPIAIRAQGVSLDDDMREHANERMSKRLAKLARRIERITVRIEDVNGPRGGVDTRCTVKVVLSGTDSVVYEATAPDIREAIDRASHGIERAVKRAIGRAGAGLGGRRGSGTKGRSTGTTPRRRAKKASVPNEPPAAGSLIGRRVGHGAENLEAALDRPEKRRRDAYVDTAAPGVSASDRKAGGGSTARRNSKRNTSRATSMLEDSARGRPSRKSTRKSANRAKRDTNLRLRATRAKAAPKARATKARATRARARGRARASG